MKSKNDAYVKENKSDNLSQTKQKQATPAVLELTRDEQIELFAEIIIDLLLAQTNEPETNSK